METRGGSEIVEGKNKKKTLKKEKCDGVLNIHPLVVRSHRINHHL
jgi:hypothetical protein